MVGPDLIGGVLGDESNDGQAEAGLSDGDAFAAAMALNATDRAASLDPRTAAYVEEQTRLLRLHIKHFDPGVARRKRFGDRLRNALAAMAGVAILGAIVGLAAMSWDAAHDHGLVVEAFSVPPDLAQRGLTGQVVARQVLDRLTDLKMRTGGTMRAPGSYRNDWGDDLKVEIPQTGVSIGELRGYLRDWLGHETHITGEVYRTASGLTLTARAGDRASSFSGPDGDLDKLVQQAAEATYAHTQPFRYSIYLLRAKRVAEERAVLVALTGDPDPGERAWAHLGLGIAMGNEGDQAGCVAEDHAALREVPQFAPALVNLLICEMKLGHDQEVMQAAERFLEAQKSIDRDIEPGRRRGTRASALLLKDLADGDYAGAVVRGRASGDDENLVAALAQDHDLEGADRAAAALEPDYFTRYAGLGQAALERGQPAAIALLAKSVSLGADPSCKCSVEILRSYTPWLAIAEARFGNPVAAKAVIATTPLDCYLCVRARGIVATARGGRREAERWFAQAIRQGPDLPQALTDRGAARLAGGDGAGALADARRANAVSPRNADALKLWGDVLAGQGQWQEARAKYDAALNFAPAWIALRQARATAARHQG